MRSISDLFAPTLAVATSAAVATGCVSGPELAEFDDAPRELVLEDYFNGPIKAWGVVQDRSGNIKRRFDVDMVGEWNGDTGTLTEKFHYYDGETQNRVWTIKKVADKQYEGTAGDILGKAEGKTSGNAVRWSYQMNLDVGDNTFKITFDDWMFLMNDGVLINLLYLTYLCGPKVPKSAAG